MAGIQTTGRSAAPATKMTEAYGRAAARHLTFRFYGPQGGVADFLPPVEKS